MTSQIKIAIIYIGVDRYVELWPDFYVSSEKYFCKDMDKHYFLITDQDGDDFTRNRNITIVKCEHMGWPEVALNRYKLIYNLKNRLCFYNYIFFFNGNYKLISKVSFQEILPSETDEITILSWHTYKKKHANEFPYERNSGSTAYIPKGQGKFYFQSGLFGGKTEKFLRLVENCYFNTELDFMNKIIAQVHDESHINKYLLDKKCKILSTRYGKPEEWKYPFFCKAIFRDKRKFFGDNFINNLKNTTNPSPVLSIYQRAIRICKRYI